MKKRLYLHIGCHKTGSTSLQAFLRQNRKALLEQGYVVPTPLGRGNPQYSLAALFDSSVAAPSANRRARTRREADHALGQIFDAMEERSVLSSENLSWLRDRESVLQLRNYLNAVVSDIRVIYVIRRQDELAVSHHQQGLKGWSRAYEYYGGACGPFSQAVTQEWDYLDFDLRYQLWSDVFGPENVRLHVFDRRADDLLGDQLSLLDIQWHESYRKPAPANASISGAAQLTLERIDQVMPLGVDQHGQEERRKLTALLREGDSELTAGSRKLLPARNAAEAFYAHFRASNERLRRSIGSEQPTLFSEDFSDYPDRDDRESLDSGAYRELLARSPAFCDLSGVID